MMRWDVQVRDMFVWKFNGMNENHANDPRTFVLQGSAKKDILEKLKYFLMSDYVVCCVKKEDHR